MNLTSILTSFLLDFLTSDLSILGGNGYEKSKLLTLGLLAGAGLLLSINQVQAADTWVKNGSDWNLSQDGSLAKKQMGTKRRFLVPL